MYTGYATKKILELITHLYSHYNRISATKMSVNYEKLLSRYNAEEPLGGLT